MTPEFDSQMYVCHPRGLHLREAAIAAMLSATPGAVAAVILGLPWAVPIGAATAVVALSAVRRAFRLSLVATRQQLTVKNYWRTYEFAWVDVKEMGIGLVAMGLIVAPAVHFELHSGRAVQAQATPHKRDGQRALLDALATLAPPDVSVVRPA